jgi:mono/diheme cytochrome c family protein
MMTKFVRPVKAALLLAFFVFCTLFSAVKLYAQPDGANLFKTTCATCHKTSADKSTGPGLEGFWDRIPGADDEEKGKWLVNWVKDPGGMLKAGDAYALKIRADYPTLMTGQPHLKGEEILAIADYIKSKPHLADKSAGDKGPNPFAPVAEVEDNVALYWLIVLAIALIIIINSLFAIRKSLQSVVNEKQGLPAEKDISFPAAAGKWFKKNNLVTVLIIITVLVVSGVKGWYTVKGIGVYEGYKPEQPIKFSHKIHAGDNQIACLYCHHSAEKGKTAGIPSVNVCMNCHKGITKGTWTDTEEISKIYAAAGWNPEKQVYDRPQSPIKWVRIHNLPDFAYFNHSQHVVVGKQECQTCHGPVETMHVLEQHSPLTMGWCIDCHKKTNVAMEGNAYYENMHCPP